MSNDSGILHERKIDLRRSAQLLGTEGRPTHVSTVLRAITRGIKAQDGKRVHLEAIRTCGRWTTSVEAVERFTARLTGAVLGQANDVGNVGPTSRHRERELVRVDAQLDAAGL
jgi:hypothetical protein